MIKKRYLMVLSIAVVSVLIGSLLYTTLVLAGKPEPILLKDAVETDVFGWVNRLWEGRELGIYVQADFPVELAFVFSPIESSFNVTYMVVVIYATNSVNDFIVTVNGVDTYVGYVGLPSDLLSTKLIQLDTNLVTVKEGINMLRMSGSGVGYWLSVYKVSLFIEYEYQA